MTTTSNSPEKIMGHEIVPFPPDTQPNTDILRRLIDAKELGLFFANSLGSFSETGPILHDLATNHGLFIGTFVNGRHYTGIDGQTTRAILEKSERFKDFLQSVEKNFYISNMWLYAYSPTTKDGKKGGVFNWHRDKYYSGYFRMIVSIGSTNKVMYFREKNGRGGFSHRWNQMREQFCCCFITHQRRSEQQDNITHGRELRELILVRSRADEEIVGKEDGGEAKSLLRLNPLEVQSQHPNYFFIIVSLQLMLLQFMAEDEIPYYLGGKDDYEYDATEYYRGKCVLPEDGIGEYITTMPFHA